MIMVFTESYVKVDDDLFISEAPIRCGKKIEIMRYRTRL